MENFIVSMRALKWLGLPLGCIMYMLTADSFGDPAAIILGVIAGIGFSILIDTERSRLISEILVNDIKEAISESSNVEYYVEIKRIRHVLIARVYLVNAKDKVIMIHAAINRKLEDSRFRRYLWIMQMAEIPEKSAIKASEEMLNEQLLSELMKKRKKKNKNKN